MKSSSEKPRRVGSGASWAKVAVAVAAVVAAVALVVVVLVVVMVAAATTAHRAIATTDGKDLS